MLRIGGFATAVAVPPLEEVDKGLPATSVPVLAGESPTLPPEEEIGPGAAVILLTPTAAATDLDGSSGCINKLPLVNVPVTDELVGSGGTLSEKGVAGGGPVTNGVGKGPVPV